MTQRSLLSLRPSLLAASALLALATGCSSTKQSVGIDNVDSLVARVERVHLEAELAKEGLYNAILKLGPLFAPSFTGDPAVAFEAFAESTETCEKRANRMRSHVAPMRNAAAEVFEQWSASLDEFSSPRMKQRSADRLEATRTRFAEVQETSNAVLTALDEINNSLRDTVLFLGHDFNAQSVAAIEEDALELRDRARSLGAQLDDCMDACADYVEKSALRGQVQQDAPPSQPAKQP